MRPGIFSGISAPAAADECPDFNALRNPYVGDLHIHTAFSFDSVLLGVQTLPSDAYAFAKGAPIELAPTGPLPTGLPRVTQLARPLDFAAVSDHAEFFGEANLCTVPPADPTDPGEPYNSPYCAGYRTVAFGNRDVTTFPPPGATLGVFLQFAAPLISPVPQRNPACGPGGVECTSRASLVWEPAKRPQWVDFGAFEVLFARYEQRAFGFFMRRTGSTDRSSDLYQELFLRLHRFRDRYDPGRPFAPWFFQIARTVLADDARRAARQREIALEDEVALSPEPDPESQVDLRRRALQLLSRIPAEHGALIVAAKVQGLEYAEIASRVGGSVDAVKQSASRALRRLRFFAAHPQPSDR